jgi:hypothetical protein
MSIQLTVPESRLPSTPNHKKEIKKYDIRKISKAKKKKY